MDRRVTPPKGVTSPAWGPQPPCKQALNHTSLSQALPSPITSVKSVRRITVKYTDFNRHSNHIETNQFIVAVDLHYEAAY